VDRHPSHRQLIARAAAAWLIAGAALCAQKPAEPEPEVEWPKLDRAAKALLDESCTTLRTAKKQELRDRAEATLVGLGAGAAPQLLAKLTDHETNINVPLSRVLDQVTSPEYAPLLVPLAQRRVVAVRIYVLRRLTAFQLPEMAPVFRAARDDDDPRVAFQAALGLTSAGDTGAMAEIFARCTTDWKTIKDPVARALTGVRGAGGAAWILDQMRDGDEESRITGLRLLRHAGERSDAGAIKPYLDSESHSVKSEAINALRVIVDGDEPLERLSVFEEIEMANQWKKRI